MSTPIPIFDYRPELDVLRADLHAQLDAVLDSGRLVLGPQTDAFESEFADVAGSAHAVAVHSGTQALFLALRAHDIGPGDEVITVANTCAPTVAAIRLTGANPVFVGVDPATLLLDPSKLAALVGEQTRAIVVVHLWGNVVDMDALHKVAQSRDLVVIEDCAQAHGATLGERPVGTMAAAGCFSFYPTKNIGAYGDAGAVVTNDAKLADRLRQLRTYGYSDDRVAALDGTNARINELQSAFLRLKLDGYAEALARRRAHAAFYLERLPATMVPALTSGATHAWHQFVVRIPNRQRAIELCDAAGVGWGIHYPTPLHQMPAYASARHQGLPETEAAAAQILSLPIRESLTEVELHRVADVLQVIGEGGDD